MPGEDEVDAGALEALDRVAGVVDHVPLAAGARHRQQMVVADEDPQPGVALRELLLDPAVAAAPDLAVVEVGLGRVDRDDGRRADPQDRVPVAEELLEVDVADVARVVVARDHDHRLALDLVQVAARLLVLVLEAERRQVARADDDVRLQVVDLADRPLEQPRHEVLAAAVQVGQVRDRERRPLQRLGHGRSIGRPGLQLPLRFVPAHQPAFRAFAGSDPPRFVNEVELECAKMLDYYGVPWEYEPRTFVLEQDEDGRVTSAFTPDFYLPEQDLYVEVTVMRQSLVTRKNRKLRELKRLYPEVKVKLFYRRDIERLAQRLRLKLAS